MDYLDKLEEILNDESKFVEVNDKPETLIRKQKVNWINDDGNSIIKTLLMIKLIPLFSALGLEQESYIASQSYVNLSPSVGNN